MTPLANFHKIPAAIICMMAIFSSCYIPTSTQVPVTVPESRQKQNYYYTPTSHNAPLLTEKNDLSASVQYALGSRHKGAEIQAAYLPAEHFGITGSYSSGGNDGEIFKYHRITAGVGYVRRFNEYWNFETYAGYTYGKIDNVHSTGYSTIKTQGVFAQPAFFYYNRQKNLQVAFVTKLSGNQFDIPNTSFSFAAEPYTSNQITILRQRSFQVFLEPGIIFRFGWKNFLFHTGFSYARNITSAGLQYPEENLTIGVFTKLNTGKRNR